MEYSPSTKPSKIIQGKFSRIWTSAIHMLPLVFTSLILYINFAGVFWFPESGLDSGSFKAQSTEVRAWLQLAAKLYEILVVASLAAISLKIFKSRLVVDGVPFGLISGVYRVGDVRYLLDSRFWRGATVGGLLATLIVVNTVLSALVGPASAILIVPEKGWFDLPDAFSSISMPIFIDKGPVQEGWPSFLEKGLWRKRSVCLTQHGSYINNCPTAGISTISMWASGWKYSGLPNNITFQDPSGTVSRKLEMYVDNELGTFMSTPTASIAKTVGRFKSYLQGTGVAEINNTEQYKLHLTEASEYYQPLVQSKCNVWTFADSPPNMTTPSDDLKCFRGPSQDRCNAIKRESRNWTINPDFERQKNISYQFFTTNSDKKRKSDNYELSSLMFIAQLPYENSAEKHEENVELRVVACSYMAHWIPATLVVDPSNTDYIYNNVTANLATFVEESSDSAAKSGYIVHNTITIDSSWISFLDLPDEDNSDTRSNQSLDWRRAGALEGDVANVGTVLSSMISESNNGTWNVFGPGSASYHGSNQRDEDWVREIMEKVTGSVVTDAIARTTTNRTALVELKRRANGTIMLDNLASWSGSESRQRSFLPNGTIIVNNRTFAETNLSWSDYKKERLIALDFAVKQYGYGYGQPEESMTFALAVIFTYLGIILLYFVYFIFWESNTVTAWGDLQDLIALAWASSAPADLKGQGVRVVDKDLWKQKVAVMATFSHQVSMVMNADEPHEMTRLKSAEGYY